MDGNQGTDDDSGVGPQTDPVSSEPGADAPDNADAKDRTGEGVKAEPAGKPADAPRKADSKTKSKVRDEPQPSPAQRPADVSALDTTAAEPQPPAAAASEPQPSKPKSLAEVMKVDLRVRRKHRH